MSRVVIIGINQASLELANTLKLMDYEVTCFEQKSREALPSTLNATLEVAKKNHVGMVFSTQVIACQSLEQDKGFKLSTSSVIMTVPTVICAFSKQSQAGKVLGGAKLYFIEANQPFDLSPFASKAQLTKEAVSQWLKLT